MYDLKTSMSTNQDISARRSQKIFLPALLCATAVFLVFLPSLWFDFVNYDDNEYIYANPSLRGLSVDFIRWAFTNVVHGNWHPLTMISYSIDYSIWGLDPKGYHLTNIVLHAANTALLMTLAYILLGRCRWSGRNRMLASILTALLFGLHPLRAESVVWISERKDVLSGLFFLLTLIYYWKYVSKQGALPFALSLIFFTLSLLSKSMVVTLPAVLLLLDFYPFGRFRTGQTRAVLLEKIPFFLLSGLPAVLTLLAQQHIISVGSFTPLVNRFFWAIYSYWFYLYKLINPFWLAPIYPHPVFFNILSPWVLGSLAFFILSTLSFALYAKKNGLLLCVWLYYVITLTPVIGIIPLGLQGAADRYTYLPSIGPLMLAGICAGYIAEKKQRLFVPVAAASVAMAFALIPLTLKQSSIWKDSVALWTQEITYLERHTVFIPNGIYMDNEDLGLRLKTLTYYNRALAYFQKEEYSMAITDFNKILEINPGRNDIYMKRGYALAMTKDYVKAIEDFSVAISHDPYNPAPYRNRALAYRAVGEIEKSEMDFTEAKNLEGF